MNEKQYNNNIKKIVKLMSMESKVNIVGSAKIRRNIYYSDYDSFETVKGMNENMIYNHFKSVFDIIRNSENTIITDFKLEEFRGKALRWDNEAIKRKENNGITFDDALKQKSMIKMDIVTLHHDGRFIEICEVYNIYIDGESNSDYSKNNI
jgi:hypothetical protein